MERDFEIVCLPFDYHKDFSEQFKTSLNELEKRKVEKAINKRKAEFTFGRICAKQAYQKLSGSVLELQNILIENDSHGAPFLKDGNYQVSISHEDDLAVAVVANRSVLTLGVDLLKITDKNSSIIYKFLDDDEKLMIDEYKNKFDYNFLCSAFFSSKEALSKLLGYGMALFSSLKIDGFSNNEITFKFYKQFKVTICKKEDYIFAFAYYKHDEEVFKSQDNTIKLI